MAGGRPTDYLDTFVDDVVAWGKEGKSIAWMASEMDISRTTIYKWIDEHEEFSYAMKRAKEHAQRWWEDKGQECMVMMPGMGNFNGSVWSRSMAARFPEDWREKSETALTGANGGAVQIIATPHDEKL